MQPPQITKGFLVEVENPTSRLVFQHNPEQIEDTRSPNWASLYVAGISHPRHQFINGGSRTVSFRLSFFKPERDVEAVARRLRWLHSLTYPKHDGRNLLDASPPVMLFGFGTMYTRYKCIVTNVKAVSFDLFDPRTLNPHRADVDIVLEETLAGSPSKSAGTVRSGW